MLVGEIMKRRVYIYQKNISSELIALFNSFGDQITVESVENDLITVLDTDYYNAAMKRINEHKQQVRLF